MSTQKTKTKTKTKAEYVWTPPPVLKPVLKFTPDTWAKLLWFRDKGDTEIGGYGITPSDDLLLITQFQTVKQRVSLATVAFDDDAIADYFDDQIDAGRQPFEFSRIWLHTHPGTSAHPSGVDEETFHRLYGKADWAIMFILAQGGATYARLSYRHGPHSDILLDVQVDYAKPFHASDHKAWEEEYKQNIDIEAVVVPKKGDTLPYATSHYFGDYDTLYEHEKVYNPRDYDWENDWKDAHYPDVYTDDVSVNDDDFDDDFDENVDWFDHDDPQYALMQRGAQK